MVPKEELSPTSNKRQILLINKPLTAYKSPYYPTNNTSQEENPSGGRFLMASCQDHSQEGDWNSILGVTGISDRLLLDITNRWLVLQYRCLHLSFLARLAASTNMALLLMF